MQNEGLRNIGHSMSKALDTNKSVPVVTTSHLVHYDILLQNATDIITKCDSYFNTECEKVYYKMCQVFHYQ